MSRTIGAKDLKRRKRRSDRNKRRKLYRNKPTKPKRKVNGKLVPYRSRRKGNEPIKIWFQEKKRMSYQGYRKWNPAMRRYLDRTIKVFVDKPVEVNPSDISTPEKIGEVAIRILQYPGLFNMLMPSHSKNSFRVSYKKKAMIRIIETKEGLHAKVFNFSKMRHYGWFWKNK